MNALRSSLILYVSLYRTMHIILFFIILVIQGFLFSWLSTLLMWPFLGLAVLTSRIAGDNPSRRWMWWVIAPIIFAGNAYVLWGWAAHVSLLTHRFSTAPEVSQHWLYYIFGFFGCVAPLSSMAAGENNSGSVIHINLAALAFIIFCIWPATIFALYGWILALVGVS